VVKGAGERRRFEEWRVVGDEVWGEVGRLVAWLDEKNAGIAPDMSRLLRVLRLSEEVGEVAEAAMGATAANPRKGASHTWQDVEHELCDVILSAMVALRTLNPDAAKVFDERLAVVTGRSLA
jgi:NTP pyrophosphatase (non-canonical NTP hydrolase)